MDVLNKSLEIVFRDEGSRFDPVNEQVFKYEGSIDFVTHLNSSKEPFSHTSSTSATPTNSGEVDIALQWNTGFYEGLHWFANNIATTEGGMHEEGFKKSLTNVVNRYARILTPELTALSGDVLVIDPVAQTVNSVPLLAPLDPADLPLDRPATNGMVHAVDTAVVVPVITPPTTAPATEPPAPPTEPQPLPTEPPAPPPTA